MRFRHSREGIETTQDRIDYRLTVRFNDHSTVSVLPVGSAVGPMNEGRESSVGTTSDRKARRSTNAGSIPLCGKDFFVFLLLPGVNFQCRLSYGVRTGEKFS